MKKDTTLTPDKKYTVSDKPPRKRRLFIVLGSVLVLLIALRLALPFIVLKYVNRTLSEMEQYYGHVEDIDIALVRGAYVINDIKIEKINNETRQHDTIPFFKSPKIDLSVQWKSIFKGSVVGEIYIDDPVLNFVKGKHKGEDIKADTSDFRDLIKDLMPLKVNHFEINNGQIHYIDQNTKPLVDVSMKRIFAVAENLTNVNDSTKVLPGKIRATGDIYEGKFELNVNLDPLKKQPTFDLNARITDVNMVLLNNFFRAYGRFDVSKGNFGMYTEFAAKDGAFNGYVKPLIKDLDIVEFNKEEGNLGQILWETLIGTVAEIFTNQPKDQFATKLPIQGRFENPDANLWTAISYVIRNAFVNALKPSVDNTISIGNVKAEPENKTFLQKIFGGKKDKDKDKKKDKK
ncbi:AsmA family protein [Emticicia fontis]